jgi:hypothetical protein
VWDLKRRDFQDAGPVYSRMGDLVRDLVPLRTRPRERFVAVFNPSLDPKARAIEFAAFCHLALALRTVTVLVEELRFVTTPSRAPEAWSLLTMTGRDLGVAVIGTTQRPACIDKDFLGNATLIRCGRLEYPEDREAVAKVLLVPPTDLEALGDLEYVQRDVHKRKTTRGRISF